MTALSEPDGHHADGTPSWSTSDGWQVEIDSGGTVHLDGREVRDPRALALSLLAADVATRDPDEPLGDRLIIRVNKDANMSRGKHAAQAVHAALNAVGAHPGCAVVVLGAPKREIAEMPIQVHDAGRTELEPGTLTAGAEWDEGDS